MDEMSETAESAQAAREQDALDRGLAEGRGEALDRLTQTDVIQQVTAAHFEAETGKVWVNQPTSAQDEWIKVVRSVLERTQALLLSEDRDG